MCGGDLKAMSLLSHKVIIPRGLLYLSKVLCCFESLRIMHDLEIQTLCKLMFYGASICIVYPEYLSQWDRKYLLTAFVCICVLLTVVDHPGIWGHRTDVGIRDLGRCSNVCWNKSSHNWGQRTLAIMWHHS